MTASPYVEDEARMVELAKRMSAYDDEAWLRAVIEISTSADSREAARRELKRRELFSAKAGEKG